IFESLVITGIIFSLSTILFNWEIIADLSVIGFFVLFAVLIGGVSLAFGGSLYLQVKELNEDEESPINQIKRLEKEVETRENYIIELDHQIADLERVKADERDKDQITLLLQKKTWATMDIGIRESRIKRIEDNNSRNNILLWLIRIVPPAVSAVGILLINILNSFVGGRLGF
ncbi:MAG: hypothetical protein ACFFBD_25215, partial [Candidatus Hodarchaeota archaeon]